MAARSILRIRSVLVIAGWLGLIASCSSTDLFVDEDARDDWRGARGAQPPPPSDLEYSVFLIGNAGETSENSAGVLDMLQRQLKAAGRQSAVIFLGNQTGPTGMPDTLSRDRATVERRLLPQLDAVKDHPGEIFFIPGHHDWNRGREDGLVRLKNQESFIESYIDRGNVFLPDEGFPGPVSKKLTRNIRLLILDTQWWMTDGEKSFGDTGEYDLYETGDFLRELKDLVFKNRKRDLLVVGHHPMYSNGEFGGKYPLRAHLTPLPVVGSIIPLYRRFLGTPQDLAHVQYKALTREMHEIFKGEKDLIYASSHDRGLQYFEKGTFRGYQHHIVSGSGSGADFIAPRNGAFFTSSKPGFMKLVYYNDGSIWLEAWTAYEGSSEGRLIFKDRLKEPLQLIADEDVIVDSSSPDYRDSAIVRAANPRYAEAGPIKRAILGGHNRDVWGAEVEYPVLDLAREAGGLTPTKFGGSGQSITVRLEGHNGREFVLRSIDKVAGKTWSYELRETIAHTVLQDQVAMFHPYGAFLMPPLSDAIGVYHTNPRYVIVPDDPRLGIYRDQLAGRLMLFEERPAGNMSDVASMGNSKDVVGYRRLYRELDEDNDNRVDGRLYARTRLLDMLVSDWDRHNDQWRWATFENQYGGTTFRPVPRDRDMAFNRFTGLLGIAGKLTVQPNYQDFRKRYGYLRGLNRNGFPQDRSFAAAMTEGDWVAIADSIRSELTDEKIEQAVHTWPPKVFQIQGERAIEVLKARRDRLPQIARKYYGILASVVDVVGSDKHEQFEVLRRDNDHTDVVVFKTSKEGEIRRELYRRTFKSDETKELRLYGLGGQDRFIIKGEVRRGPLIRVIGGSGVDTFIDSSSVGGRRRMSRLYDSNADNIWQTGPEARVYRSDKPEINKYIRGGFKYDLTRPLAFFGRNPDDGLFIGGGIKTTRHGFRKKPHASTHRVMGNVAAKTGAVNVRYVGHFAEKIGEWDVRLTAEGLTPNNIRNYYGLGNETTDEDGDATYYQAKFSRVNVGLALEDRLQGAHLSVGARLSYTDVGENEQRFVRQPQAGVSAGTFDPQLFGSLEAAFVFETTDSGINPAQGVRFRQKATANLGMRNASQDFVTLAPSFSLYISPSLAPQWTIAIRAGGSHIFGDFPFWSASTLGGSQSLRGYRGTRFAGRSSFYSNYELRGKLFHFARYLGFGDIGALGFLDYGRVWADGESSAKWHAGYGGGLWFEAFEAALVNATFGFSEDGKSFTFGLGFLF